MICIRPLEKYPVWHVESDSRWDLAMTFIRMQEWYECPDPAFRHKVFELESYMDWYVDHYDRHGGQFTYAKDWSAFNVPKRAVEAVYFGFAPHTQKEKWLFRKLKKDKVFDRENYYLIGSRKGKRSHFAHEYRHAVFTLDLDYQRDILKVVRVYEVPEFRTWLCANYAEEVVEDEIQAYALTGWPSKMKTISEEMRELKSELKKVERRYIKAG